MRTMFAQPPRKHLQCLVSAVTVLSLVGVCITPLTFAAITSTTINPLAIVTDNGRHLIVSEPMVCTESETVELRVQVTQRATGAVAEGRTPLTCTGAPQHWDVDAAMQGDETFREGSATAVAVGRTTTRGAPTDAHQWVVNITLAGE
jgi:hypothetical protein